MMRPKIIIPTNYLLIKPDLNHSHDRSGLARPDFVDAHMQKAVTGTVVAMCDKLFYYGERTKPDPELVQESLEFATEMEVKLGDQVLFRYLATINDESQFLGMYLVRYDELYARVDVFFEKTIEAAAQDMIDFYNKTGTMICAVPESRTVLYPLNGYLFIEVDRDERKVGGIQANPTHDGAAQVRGRVVAEGKPLLGYRDIEGVADTGTIRLLGHTIVYPKNRAVRLEVEDFAQHSGGEYSLYRIHRRHVRAILA